MLGTPSSSFEISLFRAMRALFDEGVVGELHLVSRGVPRSLHTAAQALLRRPPGTAAPAAEPLASPERVGDEANDAANPPEPALGARTVVAPEIQEEIERLRRDATPRRTPVAAVARSDTRMAIAFGAEDNET